MDLFHSIRWAKDDLGLNTRVNEPANERTLRATAERSRRIGLVNGCTTGIKIEINRPIRPKSEPREMHQSN